MKRKPAQARSDGPSSVFLRTSLRLAEKALEDLPGEARDISCVTVSLSREAAEMIRWELAELRKKILSLAVADPSPERVYQCNMQLFPLSE